MINSRRQFIKAMSMGVLGSGVILGTPPLAFAKNSISDSGFEVQKGFKVFNDVTQKNMEKLADELIPGSKSIGIKNKMMDYVHKNKGIAAFLDAGFWNLDALSRKIFKKPFYELNDKKEVKSLINNISKHNSSFFLRFQKLVIVMYYSDPSVWKKLSYFGPPQPKGFLDYSDPPKLAKKG